MDINVEKFLAQFDPGHVIFFMITALGLAVALFVVWVVRIIRRDVLAARRNDLLKKLVQAVWQAEELPFGR